MSPYEMLARFGSYSNELNKYKHSYKMLGQQCCVNVKLIIYNNKKQWYYL